MAQEFDKVGIAAQGQGEVDLFASKLEIVVGFN
jgi:hypothetical protein